tara:strand:+ start:454 stop:708 length:255 start_codon:yes stop_codon:yes gene_type:complete
MRITKRQLKRIIKEEKARLAEWVPDEGRRERVASVSGVPQEEVEAAILELFFMSGEVRTSDVHEFLRSNGYSQDDIMNAIDEMG